MEAGTVPRVAAPSLPTLSPRLMRLASDTRLVSLVREGRDGAFEAVYDRHHRGILSFCRHMLGDADEAEDAVQHTFMAAYTDLLTSEKPIHLRAWLFTIARNRCYTILRARREQPSGELEETATEGLASQVQRRQDLRDLVSDMRQLPEEQRAALVLAELDSLSHADIAEVLGVPREKVKALVFQARESLLASRTARDTACADIREQLACGRGASLRKANLRRHLRECDGCRTYRAQVERQRKQFALILPVIPGIALKEAIFSASGASVAGAGAVGGGALASGALKGGALKAVVGAVVASVGTAGTLVVAASGVHIGSFVNDFEHGFRAASPARHSSRPASPATSASTAALGSSGGGSLLGRSNLVGSSNGATGASAPVGTASGFRELPVLTPTKHVSRTRAHETSPHIRLQTPTVHHHKTVTVTHTPAPPTTEPSTPVTEAPTTPPVTSTPPATVVTSAPPAKAVASTPSTPSAGSATGSSSSTVTKVTKVSSGSSGSTGTSGTTSTNHGSTSGTTHTSGAPVSTVTAGTGRTGSPSGAGHGGGSAGGGPVTVIGAGRGAGSSTGSRYGSGSGGSTGDPSTGSSGSGSGSGSGGTGSTGSGTSSSGSTTASTGTSSGTATTGSTSTGGTSGSGDTNTSTSATSTSVIGGSSGDTSTTSSTTTTGNTGSGGTSTTPGRSLEPSPPGGS